MTPIDIRPEILTADYTGEPGDRTFFIQSKGEAVRSYLAEKQQVSLLAEKLREILLTIDDADTVVQAQPARDPAYALDAPIEPEWRVGPIGLGYVEDEDEIVISLGPANEEETEEEADPEEIEERFEVRFVLRRDQARGFVLHALAAVSEGRPTCQLCGLPMDPAGHKCPASNGHRMGV